MSDSYISQKRWVIQVIVQQEISSNKADATINSDAVQPRASPSICADSVPQVESNLADDYEQTNIDSRQYFRIESSSVTTGIKGDPVIFDVFLFSPTCLQLLVLMVRKVMHLYKIR